MYGIYKNEIGLVFTGIIAESEESAWAYVDTMYGKMKDEDGKPYCNHDAFAVLPLTDVQVFEDEDKILNDYYDYIVNNNDYVTQIGDELWDTFCEISHEIDMETNYDTILDQLPDDRVNKITHEIFKKVVEKYMEE